jgi:hypothetical protein
MTSEECLRRHLRRAEMDTKSKVVIIAATKMGE